jgi:acyl-CoA thioesterase-1
MIKSICVFGDSIAKGVVFDNAKRKYTFLKDCVVNAFSSKNGIEVENHSKFGCTITKGSRIAEKFVNNFSKHDYVALEFGGNDCNFKWEEIAKDPGGDHLPETPLKDFKSKYGQLVARIFEHGGRPLIVNLPPLDAKKFFDWVSVGLNKQNILTWLGGVDEIFNWHANYNTAVTDLAAEYSVPLIDVRGAFTENGDYSDYLCIDGMHPNEKGHRLMFERIQRYAASA